MLDLVVCLFVCFCLVGCCCLLLLLFFGDGGCGMYCFMFGLVGIHINCSYSDTCSVISCFRKHMNSESKDFPFHFLCSCHIVFYPVVDIDSTLVEGFV